MDESGMRPAMSRVAVTAFEHRERAGFALAEEAECIARACYAMARRFHDGGKILAFGNGAGSTDAQHLAVEFVHPVIVGKRALPAISLTNDVATLTGLADREGWDEVFAYQLRCLAGPADIAISISLDNRSRNLRRGLEVARQMGLLTVALAGAGAEPVAADHVLRAHSDDPLAVKEIQITIYHILWELVHVFFEQPGALAEAV